MEKYLKYSIISLFSLSFGFFFVSDSYKETSSGITNYYCYQGKKFFLQERTVAAG
jgi:hypothetical protein